MAWNTPKTWVTNETLLSSDFNEQIRDNLTYLKAVLDGTDLQNVFINAAKNLGVGTNFYMGFADANSPWLVYDANDYVSFDRINNQFHFTIGGVDYFIYDAANGIRLRDATGTWMRVMRHPYSTVPHIEWGSIAVVHGSYTDITFTNPFASNPAVTLGSNHGSCDYTNLSPTGVRITNGNVDDCTVLWIAVGND